MTYISLREIQRRTGISRPSLLKYYKVHWLQLRKYAAKTFFLGSEIDGDVGGYELGRYIWSERSIPTFLRLRDEGLARRGKRSG